MNSISDYTTSVYCDLEVNDLPYVTLMTILTCLRRHDQGSFWPDGPLLGGASVRGYFCPGELMSHVVDFSSNNLP